MTIAMVAASISRTGTRIEAGLGGMGGNCLLEVSLYVYKTVAINVGTAAHNVCAQCAGAWVVRVQTST